MYLNLNLKNTYLILFLTPCICKAQNKDLNPRFSIITGAQKTSDYIPLIKDKNIAVVANETSVIFKSNRKDKSYTHLIDSLLSLSIRVQKIFTLEHGFRGTADPGEWIENEIDTKTGLPIISLYGRNKNPSKKQLKEIDAVIFDIQDVGARFYTYISTLHYIMESCAESEIPLILLDRPNPNGSYIDGPVLEEKYKSFVGMHTVPVVYGMTIGEYAQMINGELWLSNQNTCDLTVIPLENYTHDSHYGLPIKPSPNLPTEISIALYPSLCFFEGTYISCCRGTKTPFECFGSPDLPKNKYPLTFTPISLNGAKRPKFENKLCRGLLLSNSTIEYELKLNWLIDAFQNSDNKDIFFNSFFVKLAGTKSLEEQIKKGWSEKDIKATWQRELKNFKNIREKYIIYP